MAAARTGTGVGTFVVGAHGVIEDVDAAACALLGYEREELVGLHGSEIIPRDRRPATAASLDRMRRGELDVRREAQLRCKDGSVVVVEVRAQVRPEGQLVLTLHRLPT